MAASIERAYSLTRASFALRFYCKPSFYRKRSFRFEFFQRSAVSLPLFNRKEQPTVSLIARETNKARAWAVTMSTMVRDSVKLTKEEEKVFGTLMEVLRHYNLQTQLRVAGGWVRDKLMGKNSSDIDIALDNMLGREFCEKVNEYLAKLGEQAHGVGIIQSNPEQSKHLETATMRISDIQIDFVNLRSETYTEHSRIPSMEFGTPEQDAYRRDLTINSLFYNINSGTVEDWTGRGISDLEKRIIATPLPPKITFLDDPLRVLRAVRFSARFEFNLDDELRKAASDEDVKAALKSKISRERIGHEIDLMITGNQPVKAIQQLEELQLFNSVFALPPNVKDPLPSDAERLCVKHLEEFWKVLIKVEFSTISVEQKRASLYSALLFPYRELKYEDRKGKLFPVVGSVIKESLKLRTKDADTVVDLHVAAREFSSLVERLSLDQYPTNSMNDGEYYNKRIDAGMLVRKIKGLWRIALLLCTFVRYPVSDKESSLEDRVSVCKSVESWVTKLELENIWEMKPLLDGNEIMGALGIKTGGPHIKEWQEELLKWQLGHPTGTAKECIDWLQNSNSKRLRRH